jgi:hypothetical protein
MEWRLEEKTVEGCLEAIQYGCCPWKIIIAASQGIIINASGRKPEGLMKRIPRASKVVLAVAVCTALLLLVLVPAAAEAPSRLAGQGEAPLCGNGSAPNYGFSEDLLQLHWTVNWEGYVSPTAVDQVDSILDELNAGNIAQTMILFMPAEEVGNRVNCAVHFLRYMQLGNASGQRKDNGFVFLVVVEPARIDVHYGVGLGLPALTANDLTSLNRLAESIYATTSDMDQALLALVEGFADYARGEYPPLYEAQPTEAVEYVDLPQIPAGPLGVLTVCGLICISIIVLFIVIWLLIQLARMGVVFGPSHSPWRRPMGGGGSWGGGGWGGGGGGPTWRGGGGSGRSGRGN